MEYFDVPTITYLPIHPSNSLHRGLGIHLLNQDGLHSCMQRIPYRVYALHCKALHTACNLQPTVIVKDSPMSCIALHYNCIDFLDFRATCNSLESLTFSEAVAVSFFYATNYRQHLIGNFTDY